MATTIVIVCPECKKEMKAPAELEGKKIRCKGCGSAVPVKATAAPPSAKAAAPPKPAKAGAASKKPVKPKPAKKRDDDLGDGKPYDVTTLDLAPRCLPPDSAARPVDESAARRFLARRAVSLLGLASPADFANRLRFNEPPTAGA